MGLFDKIKDNAKVISMKALEEAELQSMHAQTEPAYASDTDTENPETAPPLTDEYTETMNFESTDTPETEIPVDTTHAPDQPEAQPEPNEAATESATDTPPDDSDNATAIPITRQPATHSPKAEPKVKKTAAKPAKAARRSEAKPARPVRSQHLIPVAKDAKPRVIDVTPTYQDSERAKKMVFARERAAIATLAAQRRLNGAVPIFTSAHEDFKVRVFIDRLEYIGGFGKSVLKMDDIAWVKLRAGGTGTIIETKDNRRVVLVVKPADRVKFADAVLRVQEINRKRSIKAKKPPALRLDGLERLGTGIDELEKLATLYDKGILTKEEFAAKKKQILGL